MISPSFSGKPLKTQPPGFCENCKAPLDPADGRRECWRCDADEYTPLWAWADGDPSGWIWDWWTEQQDSDPPEKPATSSTAVRMLTMSEIESLQQNKRETTERLMALMGPTVRIV